MLPKVKKRECPCCGKKKLVKNLDNGELECLNPECTYRHSKNTFPEIRRADGE